jgi:hypothetical protein
MLHATFLLGLLFDPDDGGDIPLKRRLTQRATWRYISFEYVLPVQ